MEPEYVYNDFVKAFCKKDINACRKIGQILLTKLLNASTCSEKTQILCKNMLDKLANMPEVYNRATHNILERVKFILASHH